jgi:hypothetical protein
MIQPVLQDKLVYFVQPFVAGRLPIGILSTKEKLLRAMKRVKNRRIQKHDFIPKRIFSVT